jgi:hypothetical protein
MKIETKTSLHMLSRKKTSHGELLKRHYCWSGQKRSSGTSSQRWTKYPTLLKVLSSASLIGRRLGAYHEFVPGGLLGPIVDILFEVILDCAPGPRAAPPLQSCTLASQDRSARSLWYRTCGPQILFFTTARNDLEPPSCLAELPSLTMEIQELAEWFG